MPFDHYLNEVEEKLLALKPSTPAYKWLPQDYVGGGESKLQYINLKIPSVRAQYKNGFSFSGEASDKQWKIWDYIWKNSQYFEVMLLSSYWVSSRPLEELIKNRKLVLSWVKRVDNWAHSDELSNHYARLLEADPIQLAPIFLKWNDSKNPWERRQSVVGVLFYSRFRTRTPKASFLLNLISKLLDDDHYYVQKGVGWALRECWNVSPDVTYKFLKKNAHRIAPAGWTAATEKLSPQDKKILTLIRKNHSLK